MILGIRIKEKRKSLGLTQQQLGDLVKVTKVSICCYENGTRTPNLDTLLDIADVLGVDVDYLLGRDNLVVAEGNNYYMSTEEVNLIKELRKSPNLYEKLITEPKRMTSIIERTLK